MESMAAGALSALWFGILTSISPCPLTANLVAAAYIGKQFPSRWGTPVAGMAYALGRMAAYMLLSILIVASVLSIPGASMFLQQYMNRILGPVLIAAGLLILGVLPLSLPSIGLSEARKKRLAQSGMPGAAALGFVFALAFCPVSAGLFFGSAIPLSIKLQSPLLIPFFYGLGTAAPVVGFGLVMAHSARMAGRFVKGLSRVEWFVRRLTGVVFLVAGAYFCLRFLLGVMD